MSLLTRLSASDANTDLAQAIAAILSTVDSTVPAELPVPTPRPLGLSGIGTSGLRIPYSRTFTPAAATESAEGGSKLELYCPPAMRDDPALGELVNERLVEWAEKIGIYPGQLDHVRRCNFGRLIMLTHPECDDPERLLAAAKCALAEWAVDDHYVDGEAAESDPDMLGQRLAIAYAAIDPAQLPKRYQPELDDALASDPVMRALRDALTNLARYASSAQVTRLEFQLCIMFTAYNQEAVWRKQGQMPPVWEYLMHRHENSFLPCMVLIDPVAGYELPPHEWADPRVRRVFALAGTATVIVNDLYSMAKEDPTDTNLPRVIAAEEGCSLREAVQRSVAIHDELVKTYEKEAAELSLLGSPALRRFLAGVWFWLGGSRTWHATSGRYHDNADA